jgi:hypothetical protein
MIKNANLWMDALIKVQEKNDPVAANQVSKALQAFIQKPKTIQKKILKNIQAVSVSTDFAQLTKDAFNVIIEEDNFDMGWERAFRTVTLGKGQDSWQIYNVENGLTFRKKDEGDRVEVEGISGTLVTAYVDYYAGALGWTDKMIRFRKVPAMVDQAAIFRNKFWSQKANVHYLLLAAAAALNVTVYQGVAADGQLQRDIQTINEGLFVLANRNRNKGYGDTANARYLMYANPRDKDRINAAKRATTAMTAAAGRTGDIIEWNFDVIYTFDSNIVSGSPILILPGFRNQRADAMQPTTFTGPVDILTLNRVQSVWAIYGAIVADSDQAQTITLG